MEKNTWSGFMINKNDIEYIKKVVFSLTDFQFVGEITTEYFDGIKVDFDGENAKIGCKDKTTLARGLFLLALNSKDGAFSVEEKAVFEKLFIHLDVSRNRVLKVESIKKYMEYMAALGFNSMTLYMEDVFHMEKYPKFGYMRGRYEIEELKEIDDYAYSLGIEVFPSVQTLGHLEQYLRWPESNNIKDTAECLLVGVPETYEFIEEIFKTMRKAFRSDRIMIGADETHTLGSGEYLKKFGYKPRAEIIREHLKKVYELCEKYNYTPMMYSDMLFREKSGGEYYAYDVEITEEDVVGLGENMNLCYWDYYNTDKAFYNKMIDAHKKFKHPITFLGSIWGWEGYIEDTEHTYMTSVPAVLSCIENGITDVGFAMWADDGAEVNPMSAIDVLPLFSEMCYKGRECSLDELDKVSQFLTGIKFSEKLAISRYNCGIHKDRFLAKRVFFTDIFYSMIDLPYEYEAAMKDFDDVLKLTSSRENEHFVYCNKYVTCIKKKLEVLNRIRDAYKNGDKEYLRKLCDEILPDLVAGYREFHKMFRKDWLESSKPFGLETIDIRIGGVIMRMEFAIERIGEYLEGKVDSIPELEEEHIVTEGWTFPTVSRFMCPSVIV